MITITSTWDPKYEERYPLIPDSVKTYTNENNTNTGIEFDGTDYSTKFINPNYDPSKPIDWDNIPYKKWVCGDVRLLRSAIKNVVWDIGSLQPRVSGGFEYFDTGALYSLSNKNKDVFTYKANFASIEDISAYYQKPKNFHRDTIYDIYATLYGDNVYQENEEVMQECRNAQKQFRDALNELSDRQSSGEKIDFYAVETKINIMGTEMTLGQIVDIQRFTSELLSVDCAADSTKKYIDSSAKIGLSKAMLAPFADKIGGEFAERYKAVVGRALDVLDHNNSMRIELNVQLSKDLAQISFTDEWLDKPVRDKMNAVLKGEVIRAERIRDTANLFEQRFSKLDTSSADSLEKGMQQGLNLMAAELPLLVKSPSVYLDSTRQHAEILLNCFKRISQ